MPVNITLQILLLLHLVRESNASQANTHWPFKIMHFAVVVILQSSKSFRLQISSFSNDLLAAAGLERKEIALEAKAEGVNSVLMTIFSVVASVEVSANKTVVAE